MLVGRRYGATVVVKLVRSGSVELGWLRELSSARRDVDNRDLRVVGLLADPVGVCAGWDAVVMPKLTTLREVMGRRAKCAQVAPFFNALMTVVRVPGRGCASVLVHLCGCVSACRSCPRGARVAWCTVT